MPLPLFRRRWPFWLKSHLRGQITKREKRQGRGKSYHPLPNPPPSEGEGKKLPSPIPATEERDLQPGGGKYIEFSSLVGDAPS
jgi:hypothetical protein